jgi:hypothetical protein
LKTRVVPIHCTALTGRNLLEIDDKIRRSPNSRKMSQHTPHASSLAGVAYDAAAPLNKEVRERLASTTLGEFLAARPASDTPVVTLDIDDSVGHAMEVLSADSAPTPRLAWRLRGCTLLNCSGFDADASQTLTRHRISSAPVLESAEAGGDTQRAPYFGFLDAASVIAAFFKGACARRMLSAFSHANSWSRRRLHEAAGAFRPPGGTRRVDASTSPHFHR